MKFGPDHTAIILAFESNLIYLMKIWFPTIRTNTGSDIYVSNLVSGLVKRGIEAEITWFPHKYELFPNLLKRAKLPERTNLIHANSWSGFAFYNPGIPLVISVLHWVHDTLFQPYKSFLQTLYHKNFIYKFESKSINSASAVVAISEYTAGQIRNAFPGLKVHKIKTGIDSSLFIPDPGGRIRDNIFRLLFVGKPSRRKGFDILRNIMQQLDDNYLLYYTDGDLGNLGNIKYIGKQPLENLVNMYQCCDALLFPSRYEGFGYAVAEAMACGTPVITSDVSALSELVIHNKTGMLCPVDDVSKFVDAIEYLAENKEFAVKMGKASRQKILDEFTLEVMTEEYIKLYESLCCYG